MKIFKNIGMGLMFLLAIVGYVCADLPGFNSARYLELNPDVKAAGVDPVKHFTTYGYRDGHKLQIDDPLKISRIGVFDLFNYLKNNPDLTDLVAPAMLSTLFDHYQKYGYKEHRNILTNATIQAPLPGFNGAQYLELNPDVKAAGVDPVWHYTSSGYGEGRKIQLDDPAGNSLIGTFSLTDYLSRNKDLAPGLGITNADIPTQLTAVFGHYQTSGYKENRNIMPNAKVVSKVTAAPVAAPAAVPAVDPALAADRAHCIPAPRYMWSSPENPIPGRTNIGCYDNNFPRTGPINAPPRQYYDESDGRYKYCYDFDPRLPLSDGRVAIGTKACRAPTLAEQQANSASINALQASMNTCKANSQKYWAQDGSICIDKNDPVLNMTAQTLQGMSGRSILFTALADLSKKLGGGVGGGANIYQMDAQGHFLSDDMNNPVKKPMNFKFFVANDWQRFKDGINNALKTNADPNLQKKVTDLFSVYDTVLTNHCCMKKMQDESCTRNARDSVTGVTSQKPDDSVCRNVCKGQNNILKDPYLCSGNDCPSGPCE